MDILNVEIKAKCNDQGKIRDYLLENSTLNKGVDHQIDTYFNVSQGRLKLRQGNVENSLIYYQRSNQAGPKESYVKIARLNETEDLLEVLKASNGVKIVVNKKREIFFIENVKFHLDNVSGLGYFVEIEAIDDTGSLGKEKLLEQCEYFLNQFNIGQKRLIRKLL